MPLAHFRVFDKGGNIIIGRHMNASPEIDIYFERTSTGLFGVEHLFILEEVLNDPYAYTTKLVRPRRNPDEESYLYLQWKDNTHAENIFLFNIDYDDPSTYEATLLYPEEHVQKFPSLVRITDELLDPGINPAWKEYVIPLDNGDGDIFEDNNHSFRRRVFPTEGNSFPLNEIPIQLNVALTGSTEGMYSRTLQIFLIRRVPVKDVFDNIIEYSIFTDVVAIVNFHGELESEDERFRLMLENFGRVLNDSDAPILRDTDVDESNPNYIKINEKRKELLITGEDLYPYIGSYKGFVNALKYLGYHDVKLKEYFINLDESIPELGIIRYAAADIPLDLTSGTSEYTDETNLVRLGNPNFNKLLFGSVIDSAIFQKTSRFGLTYPLTVPTGEYDEDGFPIYTDAFNYTNEEILIKMYGLKKILQERYLPHHARIINITGEGIYFGKIQIHTWENTNRIFRLTNGEQPDFEVIPPVSGLKDLTRLYNRYLREEFGTADIREFPEDTDLLEDISGVAIMDYIDTTRTDYEEDEELPYSKIKEFYPDSESLLIAMDEMLLHDCEGNTIDLGEPKYQGRPVILRMQDFHYTWDDFRDVKWEELENLGAGGNSEAANDDPGRRSRLWTWESVRHGLYYTIKWIIRYDGGDWCLIKEGNLKSLGETLIFVPYVGTYTVEMVVKDLYGMPAYSKKIAGITVTDDIPDIVVLGRFVEGINLDWKSSNTWDDLKNVNWSTKYCPIESPWNEGKLSWNSLDYRNYLDQDFIGELELEESDVLSVDSKLRQIKLRGTGFFTNQDKWYQKYHNNLIFTRIPGTDYRYIDNELLTVGRDSITVLGTVRLTPGEKIKISKKITTSKFLIEGNTIVIAEDFLRGITPGKPVILQDPATSDEYAFTIVDSFYDSTKAYLVVQVQEVDKLDIPGINWGVLELVGDDRIFKVASELTYGTTLDGYPYSEIPVHDNSQALGGLTDHAPYDGYIMSGPIYSNDIVLDVKKVELTDDGLNTLVYISSNPNVICQVTVGFKAIWSDFDIDWATLHGTSQQLTWETFEGVTWDDMKYQTWDLLKYDGQRLPTWRIFKVSDGGSITLGTETITFDLGNYQEHEWIDRAMDQLRNSKDWNFRGFSYYVVEPNYEAGDTWDKYIQAYANHEVYDDLIFTIVTDGVEADNDTYPDLNFERWAKDYSILDGLESYRPWKILQDIGGQYDNPDLDIDLLEYAVSGVNQVFRQWNSFFSIDEVSVPVGTTIFVLLDDTHGKLMPYFDWEMWEMKTGKLLMRSKKHYLVWTLTNPGTYEFRLALKRKNGKDVTVRKTGLVRAYAVGGI